jgi:hypothetical protein
MDAAPDEKQIPSRRCGMTNKDEQRQEQKLEFAWKKGAECYGQANFVGILPHSLRSG